jgi:hypothetical protein
MEPNRTFAVVRCERPRSHFDRVLHAI